MAAAEVSFCGLEQLACHRFIDEESRYLHRCSLHVDDCRFSSVLGASRTARFDVGMCDKSNRRQEIKRNGRTKRRSWCIFFATRSIPELYRQCGYVSGVAEDDQMTGDDEKEPAASMQNREFPGVRVCVVACDAPLEALWEEGGGGSAVRETQVELELAIWRYCLALKFGFWCQAHRRVEIWYLGSAQTQRRMQKAPLVHTGGSLPWFILILGDATTMLKTPGCTGGRCRQPGSVAEVHFLTRTRRSRCYRPEDPHWAAGLFQLGDHRE